VLLSGSASAFIDYFHIFHAPDPKRESIPAPIQVKVSHRERQEPCISSFLSLVQLPRERMKGCLFLGDASHITRFRSTSFLRKHHQRYQSRAHVGIRCRPRDVLRVAEEHGMACKISLLKVFCPSIFGDCFVGG
jgi:hypothetical protein